MKFPPFTIAIARTFGNRLRRFTFLPRRFTTHYWDDRHCLNCTTWWQWCQRCFFIRSRTIMRPTFSSWKQIRNRFNSNDLDAELIYICIEIMKSRKYDHLEPAEAIYDMLVARTKQNRGTP